MRIHAVTGSLATSYIIENEADGGLVLLDAGYVGQGRLITERIRSLGRDPEEIRAAVVTHAHPDHSGGLAELADASDFDVICHEGGAEGLSRGRGVAISPGLLAWSRAYERIAKISLPRLALRGVDPTHLAVDGLRLDRWGVAGAVIQTPGHTDSCLSVLLDDGTAFVGDLVTGPGRLMRMPRMPAMAVDVGAVRSSWGRLVAAGVSRVLPAHGAPFEAVAFAGQRR